MKSKILNLKVLKNIILAILIISPFIFTIIINNTLKDYNNIISGSSISIYGKIIIIIFLYILFVFLCLKVSKILKVKIYNSVESDNLIESSNNFFKKPLVRSFIVIIYSLSIFIFIIFIIQDSILFFPGHNVNAETYLIEKNDYTKKNISKNNNTYSGWGKIDDQVIKPTIIYFGGNAQNSSTFFMTYSLNETFDIYDKYNFIMIDYPGYGLSSGNPKEEELFIMADEVYNYVISLDYVDENKITIMGYSLGTGVASYVASKYEVHSLILLSPYSSILDVANTYLNVFHGPLKSLLKNHIDTSEFSKDITCKTLIVYSNNDMIINPKISEKYIGNLKIYLDVEAHIVNITHSQLINNYEVNEYISKFLE